MEHSNCGRGKCLHFSCNVSAGSFCSPQSSSASRRWKRGSHNATANPPRWQVLRNHRKEIRKHHKDACCWMTSSVLTSSLTLARQGILNGSAKFDLSLPLSLSWWLTVNLSTLAGICKNRQRYRLYVSTNYSRWCLWHLCETKFQRYCNLSGLFGKMCWYMQFEERLYQIEHPRLVSQFDQISDVMLDCKGYWISKPWLKGNCLSPP